METGDKSWVTGKFGIELGEVVDAECTYNEKFRSYDMIKLVDSGDGKISNLVVTLKLIEILDGVGQVKARRLADKFPELYETLISDPQSIADACGASLESVVEVQHDLETQRSALTRITKLTEMGYPHHLAKRIALSETAYPVAIKSPYAAIKHVAGLGWVIADEIGRKNGVKLDDAERIAAGIEYFYRLKVSGNGHTRVHVNSLFGQADGLCQLLGTTQDKVSPTLNITLIPLGEGWYTSDFNRKNAETISTFFLGK